MLNLLPVHIKRAHSTPRECRQLILCALECCFGCLTSRGSAVRTRQPPQDEPSIVLLYWVFYGV